MPVTSYLTNQGFLGTAAEATIGTPVAAQSYVQLLDESIEHEPGIVLEKLLRGSRDAAFVPVLGESKIAGKFDTPLYVDQGMHLLTAVIGGDIYQTGGASTGNVALSANAAAGATGISIAAQTSPTAIGAGDYVELRQNGAGAAGAGNLSEIHKVASVSGTGPYTVTFAAGETLRYAYTASSAAVFRIAGSTTAFTHGLLPDIPSPSAYKTLTLEKCLGGLTSLQYAGTLISKMALALSSKNAAKATWDVMALSEAQITPSTPVFGTSAPLALADFAVSLFGSPDPSIATFDLDIDNTGKEYWTFNGQNLPSIVAPVERKITGKFTSIVQSMSYYNDMTAGTSGVGVLTLTQGAASISITLPRLTLTKLSMPLKIGELLMYDAEFQAAYSDTYGLSLSAQVVNGKYLPFI